MRKRERKKMRKRIRESNFKEIIPAQVHLNDDQKRFVSFSLAGNLQIEREKREKE